MEEEVKSDVGVRRGNLMNTKKGKFSPSFNFLLLLPVRRRMKEIEKH